MSRVHVIGTPAPERVIQKSCTFNGSNEYMSFSATGSAATAHIFNFWINPTTNSAMVIFESFTNANNLFRITSSSNDIALYLRLSSTDIYNLASTDNAVTAGAWNQVVVMWSQHTSASPKVKLFINGNLKTVSGTGSFTSDAMPVSGATFRVGANQTPGSYFNGSIAEASLFSASSSSIPDVLASRLGIQSGSNWKPKPYAATYPSYGFRLNFLDSASMGADRSGNGNNFTLTNMDSTNQSTSVP